MHDRYARSILSVALGAWLAVAATFPGAAQLMCASDMTGDGDYDDPGETASCSNGELCPLEQTACVAGGPTFVCPSVGAIADNCIDAGGFCDYPDPDDPDGVVTSACIAKPAPPPLCPYGADRPCIDDGAGAFACSPAPCVDIAGAGGVIDDSRPREYVTDDGARDASGACLDQMRIFSGFAMDCRPPGAQTLFQNCCKNTGKIITDDGGGGLGAAGTIAGFSAVFSGMSSAYAAYTAGASAASAAGSGALSIVSAFSPATLAGAALVGLMVDFLNLGCDAQDMETGVLRGSGMCHEIGDYCAIKLPLIGCIQKKKAHCCFNSKLGRIIQEQGRPQLAAFASLPSLWGEAEDPICRGFTPEEFQALDFSSMDLSEYFDALALNAQSTMQTIVEDAVDDYAITNSVN